MNSSKIASLYMKKLADLNPPLGYPGGPCQVLERIDTNVSGPQKGSLFEKVELGEELSRAEESRIYRTEHERGVPGTSFKRILIEPHAQYRMDLRGVTIPDVIFALKAFQGDFSKEKSKKSPVYKKWQDLIDRGDAIRWRSPQGLTLVFIIGLHRQETVAQLITSYWDSETIPGADRSTCKSFEGWAQEDKRPEFEKLFRTADLSPPLGFPGGPCHLINRIEEEISNPKLRDLLVDEVEDGRALSNSQASTVYELEEEVGPPGTRFTKLILTAHAQYRMDQRGITVQDVREALKNFHKAWDRFKSMKHPQAKAWERDIAYGEPLTWEDKSGLKIVFTVAGGTVQLVTTFWLGLKDPPPISENTCSSFRVAMRFALKSGPEPTNTFVSPKSEKNLPTDIDRTPEQALPLPGSATPGGAGRDIPKFEMNTPDSDSNIQPRTLAVPGEEYGNPSNDTYNTVTRRTMTSDYAPYRERGGKDGDVQRRQKMTEKIKSEKYYKSNRPEILRDNKKRYEQKCKRDVDCMKRREKYREEPDYYERRAPKYAEGVTFTYEVESPVPSGTNEYQRVQDPVDKKVPPGHDLPDKHLDDANPASGRVVPPGTGEMWSGEATYMIGASQRVAARHLRANPALSVVKSLLLDAPELSIDELIALVAETPKLFDVESRGFVPAEEVLPVLEGMRPRPTVSGIKVYHATDSKGAKSLLRRGLIPEGKLPIAPGMEYAPGRGLDPGLYVGATPRAVESYGRVVLEVTVPRDMIYVPQELGQLGETDPMAALKSHDGAVIHGRLPASSFKVVEGERHLTSSSKSATTIDQILAHTDPTVYQRSGEVVVQAKRFNPKTGIWVFSCLGSKGETYTIRVKGIQKGTLKSMDKAEVQVSCTCEFFRWQGPEHWAKTNAYLFGKPRGTASLPVVKDPPGKHWACKHVLAALELARSFKFSSDSNWSFGGSVARAPSPERVASLFMESRAEVPAVRSILGKDVQWLGDGYYIREITGVGPTRKAIYGSPRISLRGIVGAGKPGFHGTPTRGLSELIPGGDVAEVRENRTESPLKKPLTKLFQPWSLDFLGVWVTSSKDHATIYGDTVYQVEIPDGKYRHGTIPFQDTFFNYYLAREYLSDKIQLWLSGKPLRGSDPKIPQIVERWLKGMIRVDLQSMLSQVSRVDEAMVNLALKEVEEIYRHSKKYLLAWRDSMIRAGYDGVVWKNSKLDVGEEAAPHDAYLIWRNLPVMEEQSLSESERSESRERRISTRSIL